MDRVNSCFGDSVMKRIKFTSFNSEKKITNEKNKSNLNVTNNKFDYKIRNVKNEKIKKSLIEFVTFSFFSSCNCIIERAVNDLVIDPIP